MRVELATLEPCAAWVSILTKADPFMKNTIWRLHLIQKFLNR